MSNSIYYIFDLCMVIIELTILLYFIHDFHFKKKDSKLFLLILFLILSVSMIGIALLTNNFYLKYIFVDITVTIILKFFYKERTGRIFLYVTIYTLVAYASLLIVESFFKSQSLQLPETAYVYTQFTYTLIARFVEFLILFMFRHILRKLIFRKEHPGSFHLIYVQIFISIIYFISISISLYNVKDLSSEYAKLIFGFSFFALFSVLLSVLYTEYYLKIFQEKSEYEVSLQLKQQQCEIYKNQIEDNAQIRSIYHDMKNHLFVLEHSKPENFESYLDNLKEKLDLYQNTFQTGNPYLDVLLRDKARLCRQHQIALDVHANFLDIHVLEPVEVCIVCGNLIDNAVEANLSIMPEQKRFIQINAHRQKGNFVLKISNACQNMPAGGCTPTAPCILIILDMDQPGILHSNRQDRVGKTPELVGGVTDIELIFSFGRNILAVVGQSLFL